MSRRELSDHFDPDCWTGFVDFSLSLSCPINLLLSSTSTSTILLSLILILHRHSPRSCHLILHNNPQHLNLLHRGSYRRGPFRSLHHLSIIILGPRPVKRLWTQETRDGLCRSRTIGRVGQDEQGFGELSTGVSVTVTGARSGDDGWDQGMLIRGPWTCV